VGGIVDCGAGAGVGNGDEGSGTSKVKERREQTDTCINNKHDGEMVHKEENASEKCGS